jgi:hypothetical protein
MKASTTLKRLFTTASVYYSATTILLLTINIILAGGAEGKIIGVWNVLLLYPFALAWSGAELIRKNQKLSNGIKTLLHYLIVAVAFLLFLWLPSNATKSFTGGVLMFFLVTICYWVIYLIIFLTAKRLQGIKEE